MHSRSCCLNYHFILILSVSDRRRAHIRAQKASQKSMAEGAVAQPPRKMVHPSSSISEEGLQNPSLNLPTRPNPTQSNPTQPSPMQPSTTQPTTRPSNHPPIHPSIHPCMHACIHPSIHPSNLWCLMVYGIHCGGFLSFPNVSYLFLLSYPHNASTAVVF